MAAVFGDCLSDPRVEVRTGDVGAAIRAAAGAFDAILLDVDNGPDGLTRADNDLLYGEEGLRSARRALTPAGVLAVWSAAPDAAFSKRLSRCGFEVGTHTVRAGRTGAAPAIRSGSRFDLAADACDHLRPVPPKRCRSWSGA